jgi:TrpR family trp operon transcriptional repressor
MTNEQGWHEFIQLCLSAKNEKALSTLLELFLTAEEKDAVSTRCLIIKALLKQELPQRQMADELHVSIAKITRGSNELKRIAPDLKKFLVKNLVD